MHACSTKHRGATEGGGSGYRETPPPHAAPDASEQRGPGLRRESAVGERERLGDNEGLVLGEEGRQLGD